MNSQFFKFPIWLIFLIALQVLLLNNIQFSGFVNPFLYIIIIFWLPVETSKVLVMLLSSAVGLSVDLFTATPGMHMSACIFLAFCRPFVLQKMAPRDGYEGNIEPSIQAMGFSWFITYALILTFLHHIFLFTVEIFRFNEFLTTLGRALSSTVLSLVLILIVQLFRYKAVRN